MNDGWMDGWIAASLNSVSVTLMKHDNKKLFLKDDESKISQSK